MNNSFSPAVLEYRADGTPYSATYDDIYHSSDGGLDQARQVFLTGNGLPQRWQGREHFTVLETGFGMGLNFLATWQAWQADPERPAYLHYIAAELHPFAKADLTKLHQQWPELAPLAEELQTYWPPLRAGVHHLMLAGGNISLSLIYGDALLLLPHLETRYDALYLDGFAPKKNPALWSEAMLTTVSQSAAAEATLATWCVAGDVRRALAAAGWELSRVPGFASKREMLQGMRVKGSE